MLACIGFAVLSVLAGYFADDAEERTHEIASMLFVLLAGASGMMAFFYGMMFLVELKGASF